MYSILSDVETKKYKSRYYFRPFVFNFKINCDIKLYNINVFINLIHIVVRQYSYRFPEYYCHNTIPTLKSLFFVSALPCHPSVIYSTVFFSVPIGSSSNCEKWSYISGTWGFCLKHSHYSYSIVWVCIIHLVQCCYWYCRLMSVYINYLFRLK